MERESDERRGGVSKNGDDPFRKWHLVSKLVRLAAVSSLVENAEMPVSVLLVGPPGDGKSRMLLRLAEAPQVRVLSDASYLGLMNFVSQAADRLKSTVIIPDLGTIGGRREATGRQAIATMAMMCAEGIGETAVGKVVRNFHNTRAAVLSAITDQELMQDWMIYNQNAFLSRVMLIDFEFRHGDVLQMIRRKHRGDRSLLSPLPMPVSKLPANRYRVIKLPARCAAQTQGWWEELKEQRPDRAFGFRTVDYFTTLLQSAAYLRKASTVTQQDVQTVSQFRPLWLAQVKRDESWRGR